MFRKIKNIFSLNKTAFILWLLCGVIIFSIIYFLYASNKNSKELYPNLFSVEYNQEPSKYWNWNDTVKYVGPEACKDCHPDEYKLYKNTGMGKSFDLATKEKSIALFGEKSVIYDKFTNLYYKIYWKLDTMKLMEFRIVNNDTTFKHIETINNIVGSGHHTNSHMFQINGYLHQIPATFYVQKKLWETPPGFEKGFSSRYDRKIGLECLGCHNSLPTMVKGSENKYTEIPKGISCERCHGPGELHCKLMLEGKVIDKSIATDSSIVTPGKLPLELLNDVCTRCHLQGNAVLKKGKSFYDFKPGMRLSDIMSTFLPLYSGESKFLMASHSPRMFMSKCYSMSNKSEDIKKQFRPYKHKDSFTCITCHSPHTSVFKEKKNHFNNVCLNCHGNESKSVCTIPKKEMTKNNSDCVKCHMPKVESIDIPNITFTDHYIRKPIKESGNPKFIRLYSAHNKNPDNYTMARAFLYQYEKFDSYKYLLDSAKLYIPDNNNEEIRANIENLVYWCYLKKDFNKLIYYVNQISEQQLINEILNKTSWGNENAITLSQIADAYMHLQNFDNAINYFKKAILLAPYVLEFKNKIASCYLYINNIDEAEKEYEIIINEYPKNIQALSNLAYIKLLKNNPKECNKLLDKALSLNPDYIQALLNKASLYVFLKQKNEAIKTLNLILQIDKNNIKAKKALKEINKNG